MNTLLINLHVKKIEWGWRGWMEPLPTVSGWRCSAMIPVSLLSDVCILWMKHLLDLGGSWSVMFCYVNDSIVLSVEAVLRSLGGWLFHFFSSQTSMKRVQDLIRWRCDISEEIQAGPLAVLLEAPR